MSHDTSGRIDTRSEIKLFLKFSFFVNFNDFQTFLIHFFLNIKKVQKKG